MSNFEKLLIRSDASITDAMRSMVAGGEKLLFVVDGKNRLLGVISDGDLRRHILDQGSIEGDVRACINTEPVVLAEGFDKTAAARLMLHHRIEAIPVVDSRNVITDVVYWDDALNQPREEFKPIDCPVVIMAGGRGTRLAPFTQILPKPLIPEPNINPSQMLRTLRATYNGPAYNRALHMQSMEMLPPMSG